MWENHLIAHAETPQPLFLLTRFQHMDVCMHICMYTRMHIQARIWVSPEEMILLNCYPSPPTNGSQAMLWVFPVKSHSVSRWEGNRKGHGGKRRMGELKKWSSRQAQQQGLPPHLYLYLTYFSNAIHQFPVGQMDANSLTARISCLCTSYLQNLQLLCFSQYCEASRWQAAYVISNI